MATDRPGGARRSAFAGGGYRLLTVQRGGLSQAIVGLVATSDPAGLVGYHRCG